MTFDTILTRNRFYEDFFTPICNILGLPAEDTTDGDAG